jgi:hypothetical protein
MNRKTVADLLCMLAAMLLLAIILTPTQARATGKPETPAATPQQQTQGQAQQQGQSQGQAIDLSMVNAPAGASLRQGNSYSFAAGAAPLPPGLCPKGGSVSILFGALAWSNTGTEMECLDKVLAMLRDTTTPRTEVRYVSISPPPAPPPPAASAAEPSRSSDSAPVACVKDEPKPTKAKKAAKAGPKVCG